VPPINPLALNGSDSTATSFPAGEDAVVDVESDSTFVGLLDDAQEESRRAAVATAGRRKGIFMVEPYW
jgi:hypothetical protein